MKYSLVYISLVMLVLVGYVTRTALAQEVSPSPAASSSPSSTPTASVSPSSNPSASPNLSPTPTPTTGTGATSTSAASPSPTPAPTDKKEEVLGETDVLGGTSAGREIAKWLLAGIVGVLIFAGGLKVAKHINRGEE